MTAVLQGGKMDDITVVMALVVEEDSARVPGERPATVLQAPEGPISTLIKP